MLSPSHAKRTHILLLHSPLSTPSLLPPPFPHPAGGTPVPVRGPFRRLRHQADGAEHPPDSRVGYQPRHTAGMAIGAGCTGLFQVLGPRGDFTSNTWSQSPKLTSAWCPKPPPSSVSASPSRPAPHLPTPTPCRVSSPLNPPHPH